MNWSYISGFFDADGSIQLNRIHKNQLPTPVITFHNNEIRLLEEISKFIYKELKIRGSIVTKKKKEYSSQFELRYVYYPKFLLLANVLTIKHPKKVNRIAFILRLRQFSKRNGKYSELELNEIELLLKQWE